MITPALGAEVIIKSAVIREPFSRCFTARGGIKTLRLQDTVCINAYGHGYIFDSISGDALVTSNAMLRAKQVCFVAFTTGLAISRCRNALVLK